ncbi:hypothetical protein [Krasilnikovia sp. MM14-A1004]|uniref:hypothetical protein n=1 Tax=Krasilnikovia sp. MM14-A1004 TaxID=3373541 RepID=UPI00399C9C4A
MTDRTERSEGREGVPGRQSMTDRTERSEGREGVPGRQSMTDRTERSEGREGVPGRQSMTDRSERSEGREGVPGRQSMTDRSERSEGREGVPGRQSMTDRSERSEGREGVPGRQSMTDRSERSEGPGTRGRRRVLGPDRLRRVVVVAAMALFVVGVYGSVRVAATIAGGDDPGIWVWLAVTALVAALAPVARRRAERWADRLAYGPDGDPHAAMTRFVQRISDTLAVDEVLPDLARTASRVAHSPGTEVRLWLADGAEWRQTWPPGRDDVHTRFSLDLQRGANPVGRLGVEVAEDQLSPADRELLDRLAGPAGLALANVRLTYELRDRLRQATELAEQLRRSRERLIGARAAQRRRFAADVRERVDAHLAVAADDLDQLAGDSRTPPDRDAAAGGDAAPGDRVRLDRARTRALAALEALRELASGLYPPALADGGLVDALEHHVDALAAPVTLDGAVDEAGLVAPVRATAYFCVVGLVDDLARLGPVEVRLGLDDGGAAARAGSGGGPERLRLRVRARGRPTSDTEQIVRDRVDAFGGDLAVDGPVDATVVTATVPLRVPSEVPVPAGAGGRP